jgi:hypothetical protein
MDDLGQPLRKPDQNERKIAKVCQSWKSSNFFNVSKIVSRLRENILLMLKLS